MDDLTIEGISNWPNVPKPVKPATPVKPYEEPGTLVNDTYIHPELMKSISSDRDFSPEASEPNFLNKWPDVKFSPQERPWEYGSKKYPQTAEMTDSSETLVWPGHGPRSVANMEKIYSHFPKHTLPTSRQEQWLVEKAKPILAGANNAFLQQLDPQIADDLVGNQSQTLYDKYLELKELKELKPKGWPPK